ncbi:MAG: DUF192 domain-containing protein [Dehalococcoidia bacterium]|nr:DUF192 domain-containing protein [Dehalococcoidia bacterium]
MTFTRARTALAGLALIVLIASGCTTEDETAATSTATASATGGASPTATAAAAATGTDGASPTATATPSGEPVASTHAIPTADLPLVRFTSTTGPKATLPVEIIPTAEFAIGLSGRWELAGRGMLFYWPSGDSESGFWMKNTHIPLDIAFVDRDLRIIAILQMVAESEEIRRAPAPYLAAIEAPLGWYSERSIDAGGTVEFLFDPDALGAGR